MEATVDGYAACRSHPVTGCFSKEYPRDELAWTIIMTGGWGGVMNVCGGEEKLCSQA